MTSTALARSGTSLSTVIPFTSPYSENDIMTLSGDMVRTWRLRGLPYETVSQSAIDQDVDALHSLVRSIADDRVVLYDHTIQRRREAPDLLPAFRSDFARAVHAEYQQGLETAHLYCVDIYLTVVYRCESTNDDRALGKVIGGLKKATGSVDELKANRRMGHEKMLSISRAIETTLAPYGPELLGEYTDEYGSTISEPLMFQDYLISGIVQPVVRPERTPLWDYLGSGTYDSGSDVIALTYKNTTRYAQMICIKGYSKQSFAGMLDAMYLLDVEFCRCVTFSAQNSLKAKNKLNKQEMYLLATGDVDGAAEVAEIKAGLTNDIHSVGELTLTIRVMADTIKGVRNDTAKVMTALQNRGMKPDTSVLSTDSAYFSQIPGNFKFRPRVPTYTSRNFCDLTPKHNRHEGKATGNPWGNAVMPLTTKANRIVYLNLHSVVSAEDLKGSKPPGSAVILGQNGSGKTTLMNMIGVYISQFDDLESSLLDFTLDIKLGCQKTIEAMGGSYSQVKNGQDTGYSPFKMPSTEGNIIFLNHMCIHLCGQDGNAVTTSDRADIDRAVRAVMVQPARDRGFTLLLEMLPASHDDNSLHARLAPWASDDGNGNVGSNAWALDCPNDSIDFDANTFFGVDGTDLLTNPIARTPVLMYLLYRIRQVLGTRRVSLRIEELWQWLGDSDVASWVAECLLTIRSKDGIVTLSTQMPKSILQSEAGETIATQAATFIFMRDPNARFDVYRRFGMSKKEFRTLMELEQYHFIYKQNQTSVTATANISALTSHHRDIVAG